MSITEILDFTKIQYLGNIETIRGKFQVEGYTSFAVLRNTYDFLISEYSFRNRNGLKMSFKEYLKIRVQSDKSYQNALPSRDLNIDLITGSSGNIAVDHIFHYENLSELEEYMGTQHGIGIDFRAGKKSKAKLRQNVKLDKEDVELIENHYAREIELFNYKPPEHLLL